ncbi:MAG: hypothetical protein AAGD10_20160 [Myxococcota bacterium]
MSRRPLLLGALGLSLLVGCDDQSECEALEGMKTRLQKVVDTGLARARMSEGADKQRAVARERAEKLMASLELDVAEDELTETFRTRAHTHPEIRFERTTDLIPEAGILMGAGATGGRETVWRFRIDLDHLADIFPLLDEIATSPPLTRLTRVAPQEDGDGWVVDLARMVVPQLEIASKPIPLPDPPDPSQVPDEPGFCGSGALRREIAKLLETYEQVKGAAAETTVALPEAASWKGLFSRTRELADLEVGARVVVADVLQAASQANVELAGVASDGEAITVEARGGKRATLQIQRFMKPEFAGSVRDVPAPSELMQNTFIVPNPVAVAMGSPGSQDEHEHDEHEEGVGGLGLPPPDQLRKMMMEKMGSGASP